VRAPRPRDSACSRRTPELLGRTRAARVSVRDSSYIRPDVDDHGRNNGRWLRAKPSNVRDTIKGRPRRSLREVATRAFRGRVTSRSTSTWLDEASFDAPRRERLRLQREEPGVIGGSRIGIRCGEVPDTAPGRGGARPRPMSAGVGGRNAGNVRESRSRQQSITGARGRHEPVPVTGRLKGSGPAPQFVVTGADRDETPDLARNRSSNRHGHAEAVYSDHAPGRTWRASSPCERASSNCAARAGIPASRAVAR